MIEIKGLVCGYGDKVVLENLNGNFESGQIHGVLGKNGAGKTTLFNTLFGFHKPKQGHISWMDQAIQKGQISFLETNGFFYPMMTGMEYLRIIEDHEIEIHRWNKLFELPLDEYAENYSTGMKKKLAFLGVLIQNRPIWILDEPFNGVDIESNEKLMQIIQRTKSENRVIFISSHIMSMLTRVCDRIHVLDERHFIQTYKKGHFDQLEKEFQQSIEDELDGLLSL
jgi:ABC-2 type transport system ATP-binding protein